MADNIGNLGPIIPPSAQNVTSAGNNNNNAPQIDGVTEGGALVDKVEISRQAKALSKALLALNELSEVRTDLVEKAITEKVEEAKDTPAHLLAAKLLLED